MTINQWKLMKFYFNMPLQINGITCYFKGVDFVSGETKVSYGTEIYEKIETISYQDIDAPIITPHNKINDE